MRLTIYYCFSIIFILTSCISVPKNVIKKIDYCYDGKNTGLDSLLNLNGFYYLGEDFNYSTNGEFIFYKNGFIQFVTGKYWLEENFDDSTEYGSYGAYTLSNDTIKAQIISSPEGMGVIEYKIWFRIIDFNSLELLYRGRLSTVTNNDIRDFKKKIKNDEFKKEKATSISLVH